MKRKKNLFTKLGGETIEPDADSLSPGCAATLVNRPGEKKILWKL